MTNLTYFRFYTIELLYQLKGSCGKETGKVHFLWCKRDRQMTSLDTCIFCYVSQLQTTGKPGNVVRNIYQLIQLMNAFAVCSISLKGAPNSPEQARTLGRN